MLSKFIRRWETTHRALVTGLHSDTVDPLTVGRKSYCQPKSIGIVDRLSHAVGHRVGCDQQ